VSSKVKIKKKKRKEGKEKKKERKKKTKEERSLPGRYRHEKKNVPSVPRKVYI